MRQFFAPFLLTSFMLTGCQSPDTPQAPEGNASASSNAETSEKSAASIGAPESDVARSEDAPRKLYEEIIRLNADCVAAGGGVSGSPACDAGTEREGQLEKLGYCIDYPNNEKLARCSDLKQRL